MKKILFVHMFLTRILLFPGGRALRKPGGNFAPPMIGGWADMSGLVLIIGVNRHLINGPISILILASWTCVASRKIFITIINHGGAIKMYYIFHRTGMGREKKAGLLRCG